MDEEKLTCAALPLRADESAWALVIGTRAGMKMLFGGQWEKLKRRIDAREWALKSEVRCLIGDADAQVTAEDDGENGFPSQAEALLYARFEAGMTGLTLLPCANVAHNGAHLKEAVIAAAVRQRRPAAYLRWLMDDNAFCSTLTDCAEWLIETEDAAGMPLNEAEGAVRFVRDLTPYYQRKQWMLGGAGVLAAAAGFLCGCGTVGAAMRDEALRALLGHTLTKELADCLHLKKDEGLQYAAKVCAYLENACGEEAWPAMGENLIGRFIACVLPAIAAYEKQNAALPEGLCFALSALVMLYAGVRKNADGQFVLPAEEGEEPVFDQAYALSAFSRMSCDMPPESLAYAALSDCEVWGCDLREIEGLEDKAASQLRDMQLLGARAAMRAAAERIQ